MEHKIYGIWYKNNICTEYWYLIIYTVNFITLIVKNRNKWILGINHSQHTVKILKLSKFLISIRIESCRMKMCVIAVITICACVSCTKNACRCNLLGTWCLEFTWLRRSLGLLNIWKLINTNAEKSQLFNIPFLIICSSYIPIKSYV
jgi:hypothetical protein